MKSKTFDKSSSNEHVSDSYNNDTRFKVAEKHIKHVKKTQATRYIYKNYDFFFYHK